MDLEEGSSFRTIEKWLELGDIYGYPFVGNLLKNWFRFVCSRHTLARWRFGL